ncbi:malate:quinone oxidoreductase [Escherichia coli]
MSIEKAVAINEAFQISRQFWAHRVERGVLRTPRSFINTVPHMSFVWGEDNVNFLRARYAALQQSSLFRGMRYSGRSRADQRVGTVSDGRARSATESSGNTHRNWH